MRKWISTNARLPVDHEYKLVSIVSPELEYSYQIARYNTHFRSWELQEEETLSPCLRVNGWMDLPELCTL